MVCFNKSPFPKFLPFFMVAAEQKRKSGIDNPKSKKSRHAQVNHHSPTYILENGLRKVEPYHHTYVTYCKQRWKGRTILDVFTSEFNDKSAEYYEHAIKMGQIRVNGEKVSTDYIFRDSDFVETSSHRHEPPVCDTKIEIVESTDDMLIVSKPGGIPVHPTGRFRHNSLIHVLELEMGLGNLHIVNRLDRLTSGLVLIARNKQKAAEMGQLMKDRNIQKTYYARVKGLFPHKEIVCTESIKTAAHKVGVNIVASDGKPCETKFTFCSFNGRTSLLICEPKTGRTHQIRVHLQYLGFPIANDPLYCCSEWKDYKDIIVGDEELTKRIVNSVTEKVFPKDSFFEESYEGCYECRDARVDPSPEQLYIWLHAFEYKGPNFYYKTNIPEWAHGNWDGDNDIQERFWNHGGLWDGAAPGEIKD